MHIPAGRANLSVVMYLGRIKASPCQLWGAR